ncbi:BQ5605_C028g10451 [Microbotryum silenes-dioicae]|uniref:BQ5605_C028g10451 protein n=1 Tax=Microbotryum silenes-dioicae TaxID=796604 RepID=A0A2X0ML53_9BASI|nr:BQ5605_C028g10451 [Microbotryum silenes-dioicae]
MLTFVAREDQDVVEINEHGDVEKIAEDRVHEVLEGGRRVGETEGHDEALEVSIARSKCARAKVQFGVDFGAGVFGRGLQVEWEGVTIFASDLIEATVVHTQTKRSILLAHKQDGGTCGRRWRHR